MQKTRITLNDLARLATQLRADSDKPLRSLQERDRAIGAQLGAAATGERLKGWLDRVDEGAGRFAGIEAAIAFWLCVGGAVAGIVTMSGLLLADNQRPVNVLLFLTLFIGTQLLLLLLTLIVGLALGAGYNLQLPLAYMNPARLLFRRTLNRLTGAVRWRNFSDVVRLALLRWGQLFGIAFNIGAAVAFLLILTVTDRNFGWSSTFNIGDDALATVVNWLAGPWSALLPAAAVDADVIAITRFQELLPSFDARQVAAMRSWWPFLLSCVVVYGLLPRLVLFAVFSILYRRHLNHAFVNLPGVNLLLGRMDSPLVHTRAEQHSPAETGRPSPLRSATPQQSITAVSWVDAATEGERQLQAAGLNVKDVHRAGFDLEDDRRLLRQLNEQRVPVVIAVKSWEPPLADLGDFIDSLNNSIDCYLLLLPLHDGTVDAAEIRDWRHFAGRYPQHPVTILVGGAEVQA